MNSNEIKAAAQKATDGMNIVLGDLEKARAVLATYRDNINLILAKNQEFDACRANPSAATFTRSMQLEKEIVSLVLAQEKLNLSLCTVGLAFLMTGCGLEVHKQ